MCIAHVHQYSTVLQSQGKQGFCKVKVNCNCNQQKQRNHNHNCSCKNEAATNKSRTDPESNHERQTKPGRQPAKAELTWKATMGLLGKSSVPAAVTL